MLKALFCALLILPVSGETFRIACGSCYKPKREKGLLAQIAKDQPEAFLFMGDNVYADTEKTEKMRAAYHELISHPDYVTFSKKIPVLATWDDHDYGKNDAGKEFPNKKKSQEIFLDSFQFPKDHPARKQKGIYHSVVLGEAGRQVRIIMLDTRYHRTKLIQKRGLKGKYYVPQTDEKASMLGKAQWEWLADELKKPADLRIIVSSIQVIMTDHRFEKWSNIPAERTRFLNLLKESKTGPTILLSGDRHLAEVCKLSSDDTGLPYDLLEMTTSGMTHAGSGLYQSDLRVEGTHFNKINYGLVDIDWSGEAPIVDLVIKGFDGQDRSRTTVTF